MEDSLESKKLKFKKQYEFICSNLKISGEICDPLLKSPLDFQYHYTAFIFSSLYFNDDRWKKVLQYFKDIPQKEKKVSIEFNNFFLLFGKILNNNSEFDKCLPEFKQRSNIEFGSINNNFKALNLLNKVLINKINNIDNTNGLEYFNNLQFDDGIFPDTNYNYTQKKNLGIPHLVYHSKILMCLGFICLYKKDQELIKTFNKGLKALNILNTEKEDSFYGRSNNSLFGKSCLYAVYSIDYLLSNNSDSKSKSIKIFSQIFEYQNKKGAVSLNKNIKTDKRPGFDRYMYDIVYNSYSLSLLLLIEKLKNSYTTSFDIQKAPKLLSKKLTTLNNSGFIIFNSANLRFCFNFKGHQNYSKYYFDSRLSPFSLNYLEVNNKNILPGMVMPIQPIASLVEKKYYIRKVRSLLFKVLNYNYLPILSGNTICIEQNKIVFFPFEFISQNNNYYNYKAKSRRLFKKNETIAFSFKFRVNKNSFTQFFSCNSLSNITYSLRSKMSFLKLDEKSMHFENAIYEFNQVFKIEKEITIPTSNEEAIIYFLKFVDIKKLTINIICNED